MKRTPLRPRRPSTGRGIALAFLPLLLLATDPLAGQEFIIHANGDSINGEVKGFEHGKLEFEIPGATSTYIEFDDLSTIGSPDYWEIELDDLTRTFGSLEPGDAPGTVRIVGLGAPRQVPLERIVKMTSIDASFWSKWDGFLEFGFSFARANKVTNYTLGAQADFRGERWAGGLSLNSRLNRQEGAETTARHQLSLHSLRLLSRTWYAGVIGQAEKNQQLALDLRLLLGAVAGRDIIKSNRIDWRWVAGVIGNRETYEGLDPNSSLEALLGTHFDLFTFGDWENDLGANLLVYPGLSESGRVRVDFDLSYRQDLFKDFYFRLSFYDQYDSRPPAVGSANDFGTTIAVGWDW